MYTGTGAGSAGKKSTSGASFSTGVQGDLKKKRVLREIAITSKIMKLEQRNLRHFVAKSST